MKLPATLFTIVLTGFGASSKCAATPADAKPVNNNRAVAANLSIGDSPIGDALVQPWSIVRGSRVSGSAGSRKQRPSARGKEHTVTRLPAVISDSGGALRGPSAQSSPGMSVGSNHSDSSVKNRFVQASLADSVPDSTAEMVSQKTAYAIGLASKGALFAAEEEFLRVLWMLAQAQDEVTETDEHTTGLHAAIIALDEAEDFAEALGPSRTSVDVRQLANAHETPVMTRLKSETPPLDALRDYYGYAQRRLLVAFDGAPVASKVLYGLARVQLAQLQNDRSLSVMATAKAIACYQVALDIDPSNYEVANELGVLLAQYGRLEQARQALLQGLSKTESPESWLNLSKVHERLGDHEAARQAKARSVALEQKRTTNSEFIAKDSPPVRWVPPEAFAYQACDADLITREQQDLSIRPPGSKAGKADGHRHLDSILRWFPIKSGKSQGLLKQVSRHGKAENGFER